MLKLPTENTLDREEKIMVEWIDVLLSDILMDKGYIRGPFGSALKRGDMKEDGIPVYEQQHAIYNSRDFRYYIDEQKFNEMKRFQVKKDDLIISCSGTVGKVSIIKDDDPKGIISQALLLLRADTNKVLPLYLKYFFSSREGYSAIVSRSSGSVQVNIAKRSVIEQIPLKLPQIKTQRKIVGVLSSIDKKIKENERINNNLEQQAQAIFKSWFIDFEPFGGVQPPEMKFVPLQELCKVVTKGTTPTTLGKPFTSSGINFIKAESILDSHSIDSSKFAFIDEETNALLKRSVIKANDIVFTIAGTLGRFAMVDNSVLPANTNQAVAIIRPDEKKVTPAYLYSFFIGNWHNEYYSKRIQQAVQANLNLTTIKSLPIAVLSNTTMNNYDELVSPLFALMKGNEEENRRLSELRDTLLPKLMSSELDVSNIEF